MADGLDDLVAALRQVDGELDACDDTRLDAVVERLAAFRTMCDGVWLRAIGLAEQRALHRRHGKRDTAAWVADLAGDRPGAARQDVELAGRLSTAPHLADAVASGEVSRAKARELVRAADLPEEVQADLIGRAGALPVEELAACVERARLVHGTSSSPPAKQLTILRRADHARVEATLDLIDAELVDVALATMADAQGLPVEMPYSERRANALVGLARYYLDRQDQVPSARVGRAHVIVLVDLEVLEARAGGHAALASGAVIGCDDARRLAMDANITRVITKGRSEPLDVGRATRSVPPAMAKAVIARDRHCRFAGCTAPPWACEVHHRRPWARGGPTAMRNVGLVCWFHHGLIHQRGPDLLREHADGTWYLADAGPARDPAGAEGVAA